MSRFKEAPRDFNCPYRHHCPEMEGQSSSWVFGEHQRAQTREHEHWRVRDQMAAEINALEKTIREQSAEIDRLRAENKRLHQCRFKPRGKNSKARRATPKSMERGEPETRPAAKKRGAPTGHPPWTREVPQAIDRTIHIDAPCTCPHCNQTTDLSRSGTTSYLQEDIVLRPKTVVTSYIHQTAYCPGCRRQVFVKLEGELAFAPIGPEAKAATLYLRHEIKLPYRKIQQVMSKLFGLDFVPASSLGFEKRARQNGEPLYQDLMEKMRHSDIVHADETYWREDGQNVIVWYAGNENVAVFRIDPNRSADAAKRLLGERIEGLLVTDAYAAYNSIHVQGRQSCLAHLLRTAREIGQILVAMSKPDTPSVRFCIRLARLLKLACAIAIPTGLKARENLIERLHGILNRVCAKPLAYHKAETLRKRLIPGAREHSEAFTFIRFDGPPTNNHAERALRPLVIFRKVCMGTRSEQGSENIAIFSSLTQTAKLQNCSALDLFQNLLTGSAAQAQAAIFTNSS
jgi:transposase